MAKEKAKAAAVSERASYKFNVQTLVKDLGILEASVRVGLRKHKVKKNADGVYGWNSRTAYDAVMKEWDQEKPAKKAAPKKAKVKAKVKPKAREEHVAA